jgi:hypothetical protein
MSRVRPISLNIIPDVDLETTNIAAIVLNAYTAVMAVSRNEQKAFAAAVRAWRERNPTASAERAPPAVATIISHKL